MCVCVCVHAGVPDTGGAGPGLGAVWVPSWDAGAWDVGPALLGPRASPCGRSWAAAGLGAHGEGADQVGSSSVHLPVCPGALAQQGSWALGARAWKCWVGVGGLGGTGPWGSRCLATGLRTPGPSGRQRPTAPSTVPGVERVGRGLGSRDPAPVCICLCPWCTRERRAPSEYARPAQLAAARHTQWWAWHIVGTQ